MVTKIFVNLPVKDLNQSIAFFDKLGYSFNPQFSDETATCMVISEDIYAMLLTHAKFKEFTPKDLADAHKTTEVLIALSMESKDKIDELMSKVLEAGGSEARPVQDLGFMYSRAYNDLDGHIWEIVWMDENAFAQ
jgi:predicted lactoylglutathione lyase